MQIPLPVFFTHPDVDVFLEMIFNYTARDFREFSYKLTCIEPMRTQIL